MPVNSPLPGRPFTIPASAAAPDAEEVLRAQGVTGKARPKAAQAAAWVESECHRWWALTGLRSLRYSPGYCGWHLTGQKRLLALLKPGRIGLSLSATCLMTPIKSVSGVVVAAQPSRHAFEPGFAFCGACKPKSCRERKEVRS